jgi:GNAT superfamily N-acetyltransferase
MGERVVRLADLDEVRPLQLAVLRPDGPIPGDAPPPPEAVHVGAFEDDVAIGAATVVPAPWPGPGALPLPTWQLRSMVVRADLRRTGVGALVLRLAEDTAAGRGAAALWANARVGALGFYVRAGWTVVGEEWDKPFVGPHRWVTLTVDPEARRPPRPTLP